MGCKTIAVSKIVTDIGEKAGVAVAKVKKRKLVEGKLVATDVKKYASAHDFRRAFGTRWAKKVMPADPPAANASR